MKFNKIGNIAKSIENFHVYVDREKCDAHAETSVEKNAKVSRIFMTRSTSETTRQYMESISVDHLLDEHTYLNFSHPNLLAFLILYNFN